MSISDVMAAYDAIRQKNEEELQRRRREVFAAVPRLAELDKELTSRLVASLKDALDGKSTDTAAIQALVDESRALLVQAGYDANYLDPIYTCPDCRDTGTRDDAQRCACFKRRLLEDKLAEARLTDNDVSFEKFNLSLFSDEPIENGKSQRDMMRRIRQICETWANNFPGGTPILLLAGSAGLGKTYVSKCIMRRVIERGYTAAYYTAYRLFSLFHSDRMGESVDLTPLFEVPLLIIDDLGTEPMTRNVTIEYFFDLLNERYVAGLHTVIVTNLSFLELKQLYGDRIHSRLMDVRYSQKIIFKGRDVRIHMT
ncbi:MAG: ATP-binding protein [Christensenellaceae bacterium]|nr:ATP-binding protein [Christensenellaceae bacterium]